MHIDNDILEVKYGLVFKHINIVDITVTYQTTFFRYNLSMELVVGFVIAVVILLLVQAGKSRTPKHTHIETAEERKRREADEIVTVILPTINHDK